MIELLIAIGITAVWFVLYFRHGNRVTCDRCGGDAVFAAANAIGRDYVCPRCKIGWEEPK